jgi:glycosyltransferase involved in cell wall biosynthesis
VRLVVMSRHVTICVPVFEGAAFVAETLSAIQEQRHADLTVLVSDDASGDGSADVCRAFAGDSRFRITVQPSRLGWIEHCNWLLRRVDSELACIVSHDDILEPDHIASLVACLEAEPDTMVAFTDIRVFGLLEHVESQDSIVGTPAERLRAFIATHFDGTAFHALVRRPALEAAGGLRGNAMDHFAADVSWLGRLAYAGNFRRVPEALYRKRRRAESVSLQWVWSHERWADAWCMHCRELLSDAIDQALTADELLSIARAVVRRLLAIEPTRPFTFIREFSAARQAALVRALFAGLDERAAAALGGMAVEDSDEIVAHARPS